MSDSDLLRAIEAEIQAHRDALARLGRVRAGLLSSMGGTPISEMPCNANGEFEHASKS